MVRQKYISKDPMVLGGHNMKSCSPSHFSNQDNEGKVVDNANVSVQDIMKVSKTNRAGAVAIRRRIRWLTVY